MCDRRSSSSSSPSWLSDAIEAGTFPRVDLHAGINGWASPPGDLFHLRSLNYFSRRLKSPSGPYLLSPAGMDWLKSPFRLDHLLSRPHHPVLSAARLRSPKSFIFAVNLQVPGKDHHSAVFYFASEGPPPRGSLLHRFVTEDDDGFRNSRFKIVNRIVKGPWIVRKTVGNYSACLLGRALTCNYHRGENYLEVDVDIGSSKIASAILHLALGYTTSVAIDMGFVVEAQSEEELPERLIGAIRVCQMEMGSATAVAEGPKNMQNQQGKGSKVSDDVSERVYEAGELNPHPSLIIGENFITNPRNRDPAAC